MSAPSTTPNDVSGPLARLGRRGQGKVQLPGVFVIFLVLVAMGLILTVTTEQFLTTNNLLNVARQVSLIVIVGMGMTFVLPSGGMDISVGAVVLASSPDDPGSYVVLEKGESVDVPITMEIALQRTETEEVSAALPRKVAVVATLAFVGPGVGDAWYERAISNGSELTIERSPTRRQQ